MAPNPLGTHQPQISRVLHECTSSTAMEVCSPLQIARLYSRLSSAGKVTSNLFQFLCDGIELIKLPRTLSSKLNGRCLSTISSFSRVSSRTYRLAQLQGLFCPLHIKFWRALFQAELLVTGRLYIISFRGKLFTHGAVARRDEILHV